MWCMYSLWWSILSQAGAEGDCTEDQHTLSSSSVPDVLTSNTTWSIEGNLLPICSLYKYYSLGPAALQACIMDPPGDWRRRAGRPRQSWLRTVEVDLRPMNLGLATAKRRAQDRSAWRLLVATATSSTSSWRERELVNQQGPHSRNFPKTFS